LTLTIEDHSPGARDLFQPDAIIFSEIGETLPLNNLEKNQAADEEEKNDPDDYYQKMRALMKLRGCLFAQYKGSHSVAVEAFLIEAGCDGSIYSAIDSKATPSPFAVLFVISSP